jgi:murein DD-endopeptidase MepM/ murein hydrolase activator NlpD
VVAADSGVVIYADWMGGYGNAVIIDHGGGVSTLYGHNSELLVGEGQRVNKGQVIARAGSTGYSTGPHVHFEVRLNGSPTNPLDYLP